ncbi:MAG: class I SAM-dependent methyltransferase [Candidatus Aminicenantales bacterium]
MSFSRSHPFSQEEVAAYERKRYRGIDQRLVDWRERKVIQRFLRLTPWQSAGSPLALDAPCGYGRFSRLILSQGLGLISSDFSAAMVEQARRKGYKSSYPVGVVADMKAGLPFRDNCFHFVLCLRFFHHLHLSAERSAVLGELNRVCRDKLVISFYRLQPIHRLQRALRRLIHPSPTRISMLPLAVFLQEAEQAGFVVKEIRPLFRGVHAQCIALLEKKMAPVGG